MNGKKGQKSKSTEIKIITIAHLLAFYKALSQAKGINRFQKALLKFTGLGRLL